MPRVSAVVVSFNSRQHLERCLASVLDSVEEIVVVDSGSADGSAELVRSSFPSARVLEVENRGFGAAMNAGVALSNGEHLLLLNADTWAAEGAVANLMRCLEAD